MIIPGERNREIAFRLAGLIDEFHELDEGGVHYGVLTISITLTPEAALRTKGFSLFQKSYSMTEKMEKKTPASLAEALSRAMEKMSQEICADIYKYLDQVY